MNGMKTPLKTLLLILLIFFPLSAGIAQQGIVPFVNNLRIAVRDPEVRLTWTDIPGFENSYGIYRHTTEITGANFPQAVLIDRVGTGVELYIDIPQEMGDYFYAVMALDQGNNPFRLFIPMRNVTLVSARITNPPPIEEPPPVPLAETLGRLQVNPRTDGRALEITFTTEGDNRRISIYRSTQPIVDSDSLAQAILVDTLGSQLGRALDFVIPGVRYYYAIVDADTLSAGPEDFIPGKTTLSEPVTLPLGAQTSLRADTPGPSNRMAGLPLLNPRTSFITGRPLDSAFQGAIPQYQPLTPQVAQAFSQMISAYPSPPRESLKFQILPEDQDNEAQGESRILQAIIRTELLQGNWTKGVELLDNLLTLPLDQELRNRAEFYRSQGLYFLGELQRAYLGFLVIRDELPTQTRPWLNRILDDLGSRQASVR